MRRRRYRSRRCRGSVGSSRSSTRPGQHRWSTAPNDVKAGADSPPYGCVQSLHDVATLARRALDLGRHPKRRDRNGDRAASPQPPAAIVRAASPVGPSRAAWARQPLEVGDQQFLVHELVQVELPQYAEQRRRLPRRRSCAPTRRNRCFRCCGPRSRSPNRVRRRRVLRRPDPLKKVPHLGGLRPHPGSRTRRCSPSGSWRWLPACS